MVKTRSSRKREFDKLAAELQKYDTDKKTRRTWERSVLKYVDAYLQRYTGQTDRSLEVVADVRKRCYPKIHHGDLLSTAQLPEWDDFIPSNPRDVDDLLKIFEDQVVKFQGQLFYLE